RRVILLPGTERNQWNIAAETTYRDWCAEVGRRPEVTMLSEGATRQEAENIGQQSEGLYR
ncbi:MAG: hypothetical protein L0J51_08110, partial [Corynebacterium variabile]|nr:hypothetical protein [Corynebacterium variabile]